MWLNDLSRETWESLRFGSLISVLYQGNPFSEEWNNKRERERERLDKTTTLWKLTSEPWIWNARCFGDNLQFFTWKIPHALLPPLPSIVKCVCRSQAHLLSLSGSFISSHHSSEHANDRMCIQWNSAEKIIFDYITHSHTWIGSLLTEYTQLHSPLHVRSNCFFLRSLWQAYRNSDDYIVDAYRSTYDLPSWFYSSLIKHPIRSHYVSFEFLASSMAVSSIISIYKLENWSSQRHSAKFCSHWRSNRQQQASAPAANPIPLIISIELHTNVKEKKMKKYME